jgi:hypothetical protein
LRSSLELARSTHTFNVAVDGAKQVDPNQASRKSCASGLTFPSTNELVGVPLARPHLRLARRNGEAAKAEAAVA